MAELHWQCVGLLYGGSEVKERFGKLGVFSAWAMPSDFYRMHGDRPGTNDERMNEFFKWNVFLQEKNNKI
jgi:hypothetical protein